jgi:curved DNA-binding protein CbpA
MAPQSELELKGDFLTHPFSELLAEIGQASLNGSLRLSSGDKKCVVYFKAGQVVFAVSNERSTRVFDMLLRRGKFSKDDIVKIPNFSNDFELTGFLVQKGAMSEAERDLLFREQIEAILIDMLAWQGGEWTFSHLARIREGLCFDISTTSTLLQYARCLPTEQVVGRFRTMDETFRRSKASEFSLDLTLEEGFILSRVDHAPISASDVVTISGMPQPAVLHSLYSLWLGGLLVREHWNPAFSRNLIQAIKSAKLELRTEAKERTQQTERATEHAAVAEPIINKVVEPAEKQPETVISLEEYLERVETSSTYYDILGVDPKVENDVLKKAYLHLAKNFHPDRFRSESTETLKRIQHAFTELAHAHETLKNPESREVYDYRARKELADREARAATGETGTQQHTREQAIDNFDRGFGLLMENQPNEAVPFLARAAHFAAQNARYRAYYGRALSFDAKQRHKAEGELQAAVKLDPDNAAFRIMLAEFYIEYNLLKRAEGELNRLLAIFPSNREARQLLDSLKANAT